MGNAFTLCSPKLLCTIVTEEQATCINLALRDLVSDLRRITGKTAAITRNSTEENTLIVRIDQAKFQGAWEAFSLQSLPGNRLEITGSDERGAMFGIYHFTKNYLGVDPFYRWNGLEPRKRDLLRWEQIDEKVPSPAFRFRGWFINDEDLLTGCFPGEGKRWVDYLYYRNMFRPELMEEIVETLVRSGYNLIIPASFVAILNPPEKELLDICAARGVFLSMHHVEPMGVSYYSFQDYWKKRGREYPYSWYEAPEALRTVWRAYAEEWSNYPNVIWQIGLRGIADRPMWHHNDKIPASPEARGKIITEAMAAQAEIITEVTGKAPEYLTATLWAEGAALNRQNLLRFPDKTTIVFADNCCGWKFQDDFYDSVRTPGCSYGVYYHHAVIAGTHLAQSIPPARTWQLMKEARERWKADYAILNVSNIREFQLGITASNRILRDPDDFDPEKFLREWTAEHFPVDSGKITKALQVYFNAFTLHPERHCALLQDNQIFVHGLDLLSKLGIPGRLPPDPEQSRHLPYQEPTLEGLDREALHIKTFLKDMFASLPTRREMAKAVAAQRCGFELALLLRQGIRPQSDRAAEDYLFDVLEYPARLMIAFSTWLENLYFAAEAEENALPNTIYLKKALEALEELDRVIPHYCRGRWQHWYDASTKVNLSQMREMLRQKLSSKEIG